METSIGGVNRSDVAGQPQVLAKRDDSLVVLAGELICLLALVSVI
jgi:hypothetical protein